MTLLVLKERMKALYQKYEHIIEPILKFALAFIILSIINGQIGYDVRLKKLPVVLILSLLGAFTPGAITVLIGAAVAVVHVYFASKILSIIVIILLFILYLLLLRFTPKQCYVALILPVLFILKIPYAVPILLGLVATPASIVPTACGVIIFFLFNHIQTAASMPNNISVENTLQIYKFVMDGLISNKQMLLTMIVFSVVIILVYTVRKLKVDYAFNMAILAGTIVSILLFLIIDLQLDISEKILSMVLGTLVSAGIVFIIQFFRLNLDYSRVENLQFEDDDYYYYVKAVPKINVTTPEVNVKRINAQKAVRDITEDRIE